MSALDVAAAHLKVARDKLTDARYTRDRETIDEAHAEFNRCHRVYSEAMTAHLAARPPLVRRDEAGDAVLLFLLGLLIGAILLAFVAAPLRAAYVANRERAPTFTGTQAYELMQACANRGGAATPRYSPSLHITGIECTAMDAPIPADVGDYDRDAGEP